MATPQQKGVAAVQQDAPPPNVVEPPAGVPMEIPSTEEGVEQTKGDDPMGDGGAQDKDGKGSGETEEA